MAQDQDFKIAGTLKAIEQNSANDFTSARRKDCGNDHERERTASYKVKTSSRNYAEFVTSSRNYAIYSNTGPFGEM